MAGQKQEQRETPYQIAKLSKVQAVDQWLEQCGAGALNAVGTLFMWSAAAHAAYLAAVPETLRVTVAKRNRRLWQGLCVGALATVAAYDALYSSRLAAQEQHIQSETKRLRAALRATAGQNNTL